MTKRELNKKLKSKTLEIRNGVGIKDGTIRVIRARVSILPEWYPDGLKETEVEINIYAEVVNTNGNYMHIHHYGPKSIRKYLRRKESRVNQTVSNWVKLWGFDNIVKVKTINLINDKNLV
jgi:hypothetical protein|tara:strand:- start:9600 stop:9959 length:360 start_codon:yes stop_codon:yes gene_type:complete